MMREVVFFVHPGFALLDLSGPLEAFRTAEELKPGSYRTCVISLDGGLIASATGLAVMTEAVSPEPIDTLLAIGDFALAGQRVPDETVVCLTDAASRARRTASVCMGAFLLAACGLLDGRRATTHWRHAAELAAGYPQIDVDGDRIFTQDGGVWTSAGMTAGIDMALALIEEDLGPNVARSVARLLVVYYRRPGGQDQYSSLLELDPHSDRIREVLSFIREHLSEPLTVETLAARSNLSARQFSRMFLAATGTTPAKAVERLRVEAARPRIEDGRETLDRIALTTGFGDPERMRQSFLRTLGLTPQAMRRSTRSARDPLDRDRADRPI